MRALRTYKLRLRDRHAIELRRQARAVNAVWNYCNETQKKAAQDGRRWLSYGQLASLTAGAGKMLDIHSHTVQRVCRQYATSRAAHRRPWLRWRGRKSLGWVPFNTGHVSFDGDRLVFRGQHYQTMHLRDIPSDATLQAGSFNADTRGQRRSRPEGSGRALDRREDPRSAAGARFGGTTGDSPAGWEGEASAEHPPQGGEPTQGLSAQGEPSAHEAIRHHRRWRRRCRENGPFPDGKERARCRLGEPQGHAGV